MDSGKEIMDKLDELFSKQKNFQFHTGFNPELKDICSALMSEGGELWATCGKWWKKRQSTREKQVEETVDILHFFLTLCLRLGITPQELYDAYCEKLKVNYQRQADGY